MELTLTEKRSNEKSPNVKILKTKLSKQSKHTKHKSILTIEKTLSVVASVVIRLHAPAHRFKKE